MKRKLSILLVMIISLFAFTGIVRADFCPGDNYSWSSSEAGLLLVLSNNKNITCKNSTVTSGTFAKMVMDQIKTIDPTILSDVIDSIVDFDKGDLVCHIGDVEYDKDYFIYYITYNTDGMADTVANKIISTVRDLKNNKTPSLITRKKIHVGSEKQCKQEGQDNSSKNSEKGIEGLKNATDFCSENSNPQVLAAFKLIGYVIVVIKILVPLVLIAIGMIDISKAVVDGKDGELQKNVITFSKRLAIGALVFFIPTIILGFFDGLSNIKSSWRDVKKSYDNCLNCLLKPSDCPDVKLINDK